MTQLRRTINQQTTTEYEMGSTTLDLLRVYDPGKGLSYGTDTEQRRLYQQRLGGLKCSDQIQNLYSFLINGFRGILPMGVKRAWGKDLT